MTYSGNKNIIGFSSISIFTKWFVERLTNKISTKVTEFNYIFFLKRFSFCSYYEIYSTLKGRYIVVIFSNVHLKFVVLRIVIGTWSRKHKLKEKLKLEDELLVSFIFHVYSKITYLFSQSLWENLWAPLPCLCIECRKSR